MPRGIRRSGKQLPTRGSTSSPLDDAITRLEPFRCQDVASLAILILEQSDARGPVRIVLDGHDLGPDTVFAPLEVDQAVHALVAAATESARWTMP